MVSFDGPLKSTRRPPAGSVAAAGVAGAGSAPGAPSSIPDATQMYPLEMVTFRMPLLFASDPVTVTYPYRLTVGSTATGVGLPSTDTKIPCQGVYGSPTYPRTSRA